MRENDYPDTFVDWYERLKNIQRFFQIDIGDFYRLDLKMKKVIMVELKIDIGDKI